MTARYRSDVVTTGTITLYSLVVAASFARVFDGWRFLGELAIVVVAGHGWSFIARRLRIPTRIDLPLVVLGLTWLVTMLHLSATTSSWLPTAATRDRVVLELRVAAEQFPTAVAPVPYAEGWALLALVGTAVVVILTDLFAFRARARAEALVPGAVLFVVIAAVAAERLRWESAIALVASGYIAIGTLRSLHDGERTTELRPPSSPVQLTGPAVVGSALVIAAVAGLVGPRVPGVDADPIYETRGRSGVTTIVSPLVDIRSRLTSRGNEELFRVDADAPAYWRVSTLASFDGQRFTLPRRPLEGLTGVEAAAGEGRTIRQQVQVIGLGGVLVPAAADPIGAEGVRGEERIALRVDRDSSALLGPDELRTGDVFRIVSEQTTPAVDLLRSSASSPPDPVFTALPDDLPAVVGRLATEVTSGAPTPYDQAIMLQAWFRDPTEFAYSLDVQSGHGSTAIELFLDRRVGYCEQFAATFATMARTLGLPSRVAVGFTPGTLADDGWFRVRGKNAHAWPELWFDDVGWLAFEPTPGRGIPGAESYTGVAAAQEGSDAEPPVPPTTAPSDPAVSSTQPPTVTDPGRSESVPPTTAVAGEPGPPTTDGARTTDSGAVDAATEPPSDDADVSWLRRFVAVTLLAGGAAAVVLTVRSVATRRARRRPASTRIASAWRRACEAASLAGVDGRPSMTSQEWATATAAVLPIASRPMSSLAGVVDLLLFAPDGTVDPGRIGAYGVPLVRECEQWAEQVERLAVESSPPFVTLRRRCQQLRLR